MKAIIYLGTILISASSFAQVAKTVVVEHFTNTRCGICASKNPGFYSNLDNNADVLHLAIHPSSPYSTCELNLYNVSENDARTNFYGVYGGTPRFVIQGEVLPTSVDASSATLFDSYKNQQSNFSVEVKQEYGSSVEEIKTTVTITREAAGGLTKAWLYAVIAESELDLDAPNGEQHHYDVFRNSLFGSDGQSVDLPVNIGESKSYSAIVDIDDVWTMNNVYALAILQDETSKEVLQASSSEGREITGIATTEFDGNSHVYPNPTTGLLNIGLSSSSQQVTITNLSGQIVMQKITSDQNIDLSQLPSGVYIVAIAGDETLQQHRIIKE
ncbi:MAG: T9SS type A sorting domain-containing protein [Flavobacteriales bacterium]